MNESSASTVKAEPVETGLRALCAIAAFYRVAADAEHLRRELALDKGSAQEDDPVSYTHLDVYKRQGGRPPRQVSKSPFVEKSFVIKNDFRHSTPHRD